MSNGPQARVPERLRPLALSSTHSSLASTHLLSLRHSSPLLSGIRLLRARSTCILRVCVPSLLPRGTPGQANEGREIPREGKIQRGWREHAQCGDALSDALHRRHPRGASAPSPPAQLKFRQGLLQPLLPPLLPGFSLACSPRAHARLPRGLSALLCFGSVVRAPRLPALRHQAPLFSLEAGCGFA